MENGREDNCGKNFHVLLCVIINSGLSSKVIKIAKQCGISGATVFLGKGTVDNHLLELLSLNDTRKEIVFMITEKKLAYEVMESLNKKFNFKKPNHGIAFSTALINVFGSRNCQNNDAAERGVKEKMYNAIFTVVDKGNAESVIDAAVLAGSKGGTIINARGSGIHEKSRLFYMDIEPEKEIIMILAEKSHVDTIVDSIRKNLQIDEPGNGVMFILGVDKTLGLY